VSIPDAVLLIEAIFNFMQVTNETDGPGRRELSARQREIVETARQLGSIDVEALAARYMVTPQTIRRDLAVLCEAAYLRRVHGGAVVNEAQFNPGYRARRHIEVDAKRRIGALAAQLIPDGGSLFINIGTTNEQVAERLRDKHDLTVITNSVNVVSILMGSPGLELIVAGGVVRHEDGGVVGERASGFLSQFRVDFAIIGTSAIDSDGALLEHDYREVMAARAIIEHARSVILVADHSKFERTAPIRIAGIDSITHFVTDSPPPPAFVAACAAGGVTIHVAQKS
jgi:DeoR family transcriptional regulator, glycerol-3-phosphate regulon repressor